MQRFREGARSTKKEETYFSLTGQFQEGYITPRLQELSAYYSTLLSYQHVENLVTRITGFQQLSDQKIWQIVNDKAVEISRVWRIEAEETLNSKALSLPKIQEKVGLNETSRGGHKI